MAPWHFTEHYVRLRNSCCVPVCTGEDIYLKENFAPLLTAGGVSVIHPDVLTAGGMLETKKIGEMAHDCGVAEPSTWRKAHRRHGRRTRRRHYAQVLAVEFHSVDVPYWQDIVNGLPKPLIQNGFITMPDAPGLA